MTQFWEKRQNLKIVQEKQIFKQPKCSQKKNIYRICCDSDCNSRAQICDDKQCKCNKEHENCGYFLNFTCLRKIMNIESDKIFKPILELFKKIAQTAINEYNQFLKIQQFYFLEPEIEQTVSKLWFNENIKGKQTLKLRKYLQIYQSQDIFRVSFDKIAQKLKVKQYDIIFKNLDDIKKNIIESKNQLLKIIKINQQQKKIKEQIQSKDNKSVMR